MGSLEFPLDGLFGDESDFPGEAHNPEIGGSKIRTCIGLS